MATSQKDGKAPVASRIHGGVIAPGLTKPGTSHRRQKRMGPAPFASFEDLSDELESPEDKNAASVVRLPGIREDATPCSPAPSTGAGEIRAEFIYTGISLIGAPSTPTVTGRTPTIPTSPNIIGEQPTKYTLTPRIEFSRASSSSHHDSKESTPEKEESNTRIGLEEGAVDLRSSTEEMEIVGMDPSSKQTPAKAPPPPPPPRTHSPHHHDHQLHEDSYHSHNRKDSQSSELGLLCISGRTSRLSSIGSQGSAQSRVSNASHLSVVSGTSRSPSPHKMLLETSFCGTKPKRGALSVELYEVGKDGEEDLGTKQLEMQLLQRQHDPTKVLIAEGVDINIDNVEPRSSLSPSPRSPIPQEPEVIIKKVVPVKTEVKPSIPKTVPKTIPKPKTEMVTIKIDKPDKPAIEDTSDDVQRPKLPKHVRGKSGTEYIYIPLKGPLPDDPPGYDSNGVQKTKVRETKSAGMSQNTKDVQKRKSKSASPSPAMTRHYQTGSGAGAGPSHRASADEPKYIRIRLKPEHLYDDYDPSKSSTDSQSQSEIQKPETLNLQTNFDEITVSPSYTKSQSQSHTKYLSHDSPNKHKSPSPSLSRKSSFASLFKSRETISPESPTPGLGGRKQRKDSSHGRRSRSKSRDRSGVPSSTESIDSKGRSVFSLFSKPRKASSRQSLDRSPGPDLPNLENLAQNIQNTSKSKRNYFETPLQGESIRIPLHSPTYYESKNFFESFKTSSQDSQETVIEVKTDKKGVKDEQQEDKESKEIGGFSGTIRQSSTSSENIVFSTKLGSNNDIFTTKLPKHQEIIETTTAIVEYVKERVTSDDEEFIKSKVRSSGSSGSRDFHKSEQTPIKSSTEESKPEKSVTEEVPEPPRRISTSTSSDSRKFRLEKSKRIESLEHLTQSTSSSSYIPKSDSKGQIELSHGEQVESFDPSSKFSLSPKEKPESPQSISPAKEKPFLQQQSSEDIPIIAKEKLKLAELKKSEEHYSSESERESDLDRREKKEVLQELEPERKGLVLQQDSFEDELPYIPTTLPQERSMAVPIIPVKQRSCMDIKTCTIERPRSTTPIKPTLEVYQQAEKQSRVSRAEKLKISLPKGGDDQQPKVKSPRKKIDKADTGKSSPSSRPSSNTSSDWFDFSRVNVQPEETPPPLPPKGMQKEWINFEEIPEKRKPPKRIQTIPSRSNIEIPESLVQAQENVIYTYVNPEDCKCECHERPMRQPPPPPPPAPPPKYTTSPTQQQEVQKQKQKMEEEVTQRHLVRIGFEADEEDPCEDEMPLLDDEEDESQMDREKERLKLDSRSVISDSSVDLSTMSHIHEETANGTSLTGTGAPFTTDLGVSGTNNSNRSSIISQDDQPD